MIPYLGGLVAVAMPMMVAIVTKPSPIYAIYVIILYYIIQLIDNNYIVPYIVASKVKINALFSIIAVSYTHLRAHETDSYLVCRLLLEKKKKKKKIIKK